MAKSEMTQIAEKKLIKRAIEECRRFCLEVEIGSSAKDGIVDFVTIDFKNTILPEIICYEIKVTELDFKSKNGHNFSGDYNYYVMPVELYEKLKDTNQLDSFRNKVGVITFGKREALKIVRKSSRNYKSSALTFDERMLTIDSFLKRWTTGSMIKYLKRYGIELRNDNDQLIITEVISDFKSNELGIGE